MRWFDRKFEFSFPTAIYPSICERLAGLPPRVQAMARAVPDPTIWSRAPSATEWSAQTHLGHLADLESLWQGRIEDFRAGANELRPADVENRKTHDAHHDEAPLATIVGLVIAGRAQTERMIQELAPEDFGRTARHPRLQTPMRLVDSLFFAAEHDDHHLARIRHLCAQDPDGPGIHDFS